ncbi:hypothetical protein ACSRUE_04320 [Sorangium sp. KYC3313]|uniref:hypothetical protein n=1 Tax=Sorangium sp. KYC3313 TaxID=3449740 RepID=UPI003F8C8F94
MSLTDRRGHRLHLMTLASSACLALLLGAARADAQAPDAGSGAAVRAGAGAFDAGPPGAADARSARRPAPDVPVGGFVDLEWRVMGLGGHVSHGPAFAAGVTLANGLVRLGLGGLGRPGPMNPATFEVALPGGQTYKGQRTLELKSDGSMLGAHVGLSFRLPFAQALAVQIPITVGYGGFGFYLQGNDRKTPDGRRVSAWEDELFAGKDSFLGLVVDTGLRLGYQPDDAPWFRPYVGASFTAVPGFDTVARDDYLGFSGVLGVELGHGI